MWAHPRGESKGAKLERESQPVMPSRPDILDVVEQRVMAQQGGLIRGQVEQGGTVRKGNRLSHTQPAPFPLASDPAPTGIDPRQQLNIPQDPLLRRRSARPRLHNRR